MTGGSLGLRSSSSGTLPHQQPQLQQDQLPSPPPFSPSIFVSRKLRKIMKEKERLYPWILKFGRKKVGMLFICVISAAIFAGVLYMGKADNGGESVHVPSIRFSDDTDTEDRTLLAYGYGEEKTSPVYFTGYALPPGNPCESFALPPPPADKKRTGPRPCPVCYLPVEQTIALMPTGPSFSPVLKNLTYAYEENSSKTEFGGSEFGGYPSLKQRDDSYDIRESMTVHCGFVKGTRAGRGTGYDIDDADLYDMDQCRGIVVASAIFGNFDVLRQPKNISETARRTVCFFMFLDEVTEEYMRNNGDIDGSKKVGVWRVVVVRNIPYTDARRTGKIPKLLMHRLFPNARYSIWMDGKLELVVDPYQILERFLWRENATFAISRHYKRFDSFVEAEANKAAGKYDNASIDFQIEFYKKEGLTPYTPAKLPITSDVPEGCLIIREHIPISNLFTCLWFHEVDRFTSRDQISFAIVRDKIRAKTNWTISMFLDCERRNFVVQGYHRDVLQKKASTAAVLQYPPPPPPPLVLPPTETTALPSERGEGRSRGRKVDIGRTDTVSN